MSIIYINPYRYSLGLLDQYGGAAAAYSLRALSIDYTNPVVRVRRDNDNAEQDFTATEVSDGTLAAWVGAGNDGFVRTWYDQSENGNNANQTVATDQPKIVDNGAVALENGKPCLSFNGSTHKLAGPIISSIVGTQPRYFATVSKSTRVAENTIITWDTSDIGGAFVMSSDALSVRFRFTAGQERLGVITTGVNLISWLLPPPANNSNLSSVSCNGIATPLTLNRSINTQPIPFFIGEIYQNTTNKFSGTMQEIVLYSGNQSTNRAAIEANINSHYNIF